MTQPFETSGDRSGAVPHLTDSRVAALPGVRHGFFTRNGGVSGGVYRSLNCGIGSRDDRSAILANRAKVAATVGVTPDRLATPHQVHGNDAIPVVNVWAPGHGPHVDAVVTERPGIALGIGTADCGPILLAEADAGVIGAAHAGWRGSRTGIVEAAIAAMERLGAHRNRIVAALGPTISQSNYEVGPEIVAMFLADDSANERFFVPSARLNHARFDLAGYIVARLEEAGIAASKADECTYADADRFYSYRRATHRGEPDYGRQLSVIALAE